MTAQRLQVTYELRSATSVEWASRNPILNKDEPGFDRTAHNFKMGDGVTHWEDLDWFLDLSSSGPEDDSLALAALQDHVDSLTPHSVYDDGPSLALLYENAKV